MMKKQNNYKESYGWVEVSAFDFLELGAIEGVLWNYIKLYHYWLRNLIVILKM